MPLRLRRAAEPFPRARWEPSNEHLVIMSGETVVGSLKRQTGGTAGDRWFWSITWVLIELLDPAGGCPGIPRRNFLCLPLSPVGCATQPRRSPTEPSHDRGTTN